MLEVLAKRNRSYDDELYLAFLSGNGTARRIRSAYRKNAVGTIAHLTCVAPKCEFYRTLVETLAECVQPDRRRPDRWERRAFLALTDKGRLAEHLKAAHKLDEMKTLDFVDLLSVEFQRRAVRALGAAFRKSWKVRTIENGM